MIVENSLNEKIKHEETCTMYHNSTEVDYFTKETFTRKIQKPRMKKHTNEPMTLPKPSQMRASSTLTNPFITSAENDSSNVSPANDDAQNSSHIHQQADEAPEPFNFSFNFN